MDEFTKSLYDLMALVGATGATVMTTDSYIIVEMCCPSGQKIRLEVPAA